MPVFDGDVPVFPWHRHNQGATGLLIANVRPTSENPDENDWLEARNYLAFLRRGRVAPISLDTDGLTMRIATEVKRLSTRGRYDPDDNFYHSGYTIMFVRKLVPSIWDGLWENQVGCYEAPSRVAQPSYMLVGLVSEEGDQPIMSRLSQQMASICRGLAGSRQLPSRICTTTQQVVAAFDAIQPGDNLTVMVICGHGSVDGQHLVVGARGQTISSGPYSSTRSHVTATTSDSPRSSRATSASLVASSTGCLTVVR